MDYTVVTNQTDIHDALEAIVQKHATTDYQNPISDTQQHAFESALPLLSKSQGRLILDAGCGTGMSTTILSKHYPTQLIVGVDKSCNRLQRNTSKPNAQTLLCRADLIPFFQQAKMAKLFFEKIYFFYPNPWPKSKHVKRRFYGHPIFPTILQLTHKIEVRSNWKLYLEEFAYAAKLLGWQASSIQTPTHQPMSLFEKKYIEANCRTYQLELSKVSKSK